MRGRRHRYAFGAVLVLAAWNLKRRFPGSRLVFADASGHSASEANIGAALVAFFRQIAASATP